MKDIRFWRKSIKAKLVLVFLLLSLLPAILVGYLAFEKAKSSLEEQVTEHLTSIVALKSQEVNQWFKEEAEDVESLTVSPYLVENHISLLKQAHDQSYPDSFCETLRDYLKKRLGERDDFFEFLLMDLEGKIVVSTDSEQEGKYKSNRPYFIEGKEGLFIQNVYHSLTLGEPAITISAPLSNEGGEVVGVVAGRANLATLSEIMEEYSGLGKTGNTYLVNKYNFFVTEPRFGNGYALKKAIHTEAVKECLEHKSGTGLYYDYQGKRVVGAYMWMAERELGLFAEMNQSEAFGPVYSLRSTVLLILTGVIVIATLLGLLMSTRITKPIRRLATGALAIGKGDLTYRVKIDSEDELGQLASSFNKMTEDLQNTTISKDYMDNIFGSMLDALIVLDLDAKIRTVNKATCELLAYSEEELIGMPVGTIFAVLEETLLKATEMDKLIKEEGLMACETDFEAKDGRKVPVLLSSSVMKDEDGKVICIVCTARDITERKQAEEALGESEEKYRAIVDVAGKAGEAIVVVQDTEDTQGAIVFANEEVPTMLGYSQEELLGKPFSNFVSPDSLATVEERYRQRQKGEDVPSHYEVTALHKDGTAVPIEVAAGTMNYQGKLATVVYWRDMTDRKQAEDREKQLQQELNLSRRLASIGQMASGVAHEINNPLTSVIGFSQLLLRRDLPEDIRKRLETINNEAQRVAKIVENLLSFARRRKPGREYIDVNEIISQTLELRSYEMRANNIQVVIELSPELLRTVADPGQLQQVFLNIVLNAEKAIGAEHGRGTLVVKTERIGNIIRVSFTDDGPGISKENLDNIFDPFFTTREVGNGTGLGLSICYGIVAQHKGKLYAQSELGKGATFFVELPIVSKREQQNDTEATSEEVLPPRSGAKILVVDDELSVLDFLSSLLTEEGFHVETTDRANVALEKLKRQKYDLLLLDIKMPGMSGTELYHHIKAIDPALAQRVLFITGDIIEPDTTDFLKRAKVPYITKPLNIERLTEEINRILGRNQR